MRDYEDTAQMKHAFTREQVKRIILEELENSKVDDAAEEIVDELEGMLSEAEGDSALKTIYDKIFKKSEEENLDADELAIRVYKRGKQKSQFKKILGGMALAAFLGGVQAHIDMNSQIGAQAKTAQKTTQQALKNIKDQSAEKAVERLDKKLSSSVLYKWSLNPDAAPETMDDMIVSMDPERRAKEAPTASPLQDFPMFQDYDWGRVFMMGQSFGVVVKVKNDIQKQIDQGVKNKKDLKPMIDLDNVRPPDYSVSQFAKMYKDLYDIPDYKPWKGTSKEAIGGHIEQVQRKTGNKIKFYKFEKEGHSEMFGYETYELVNMVNPELPNAPGLSASELYVQLFNEVTGQNIQP